MDRFYLLVITSGQQHQFKIGDLNMVPVVKALEDFDRGIYDERLDLLVFSADS